MLIRKEKKEKEKFQWKKKIAKVLEFSADLISQSN